jgi:hypothetical protein
MLENDIGQDVFAFSGVVRYALIQHHAVALSITVPQECQWACLWLPRRRPAAAAAVHSRLLADAAGLMKSTVEMF